MSDHRYTGLKFILDGGAFVQVVVTTEKASSLVDMWSKHLLKGVFGEVTSPFGSWAVKAESLRAMHTFPVDVQAGPQGPGLAPGWGSGLPN